MGAIAEELRGSGANLIYGSVRMIERDDETVLAWARQRYACVVMNLHVELEVGAIESVKRVHRALVDLARERDGSYYPTYQRWTTREQVEACHPRLVELLRSKLRFDPEELFQGDWYRHHRAMFADEI